MTTKLINNSGKPFPSREELNQMTIYKLSLKAMESEYFKEMVIDYLVGRQYKRSFVFIKDVEMSARLKSALRGNKIKSLNQLTLFKMKDVSKMPGIGLLNLQELLDIMDHYDYQFDSHIEGLEVLL